MIFPDEVVAGWFFLSNITDPDLAQKQYEELRKKVSYIPESYAQWYNWYLDYYANYETFPKWSQFRESSQMENDCKISPREAQFLFSKELSVWESDALCDRMKGLPLNDRAVVLERLSKVLQSEAVIQKPILSDDTFDLEEQGMILTEKKDESRFKLPIKHLNEATHLKPGNTVSIIAGPGHGKTQMATNIVYLNSVKGEMNSLYIYLENLPSSYISDLYSRFSFDSGAKIENASLKQGVSVKDESAVKAVRQLKKDYDEQKKGHVYFKPFSDYPTDPLKFGAALAADVNRLGINVIVLDYLQRCKVFAPLRMDSMAYLNQIMSTVSQVALGGFEADHPSIGVVLVQPNREAQTKAERTKGNSYNTFSVAEVSSCERDSFVMLALYSSAEGKAAGQMSYKIVKNRDGETDVSVLTCPYMPNYCYIGDVSEGTDVNVYSNEVMDDVFDLDL